MNKTWAPWLTLAIASCVLAFSFNGRALLDTSETRYAEPARKMAVDGNWLVPVLAGEPHLTKPPTTYWLIALSIRAFGRAEWAVRFPYAICFVATVMMTASLAWLMWRSLGTALLAGWLQTLSVMPLMGSNVVTTDTFVAGFETLAMLCVWGSLTAADSRRPSAWRMGLAISLALAFMTKGPPGVIIILPIAAFLVFYHRTFFSRKLFSVRSITLFLALSLAWYLVVWFHVPDAIAVWKDQAIKRVILESDRNMPRSLYILLIAFGGLPATAVISLPLARFLARVVRRGGAEGSPARGQGLKAEFHEISPPMAFLILWVLLPFAVFCLSKVRLYLYILPLFPPISIMGAKLLAGRWKLDSTASDTESRTLEARWVARVPNYAKVMAGALLVALLCTKFWVERQDQNETKNFKPVAQAIYDDSKRIGLKPTIILAMPYLGNGVLYYLNGPPAMRVHPPPDHEFMRPKLMADVLTTPVASGYAQYVIMRDDAQPKYPAYFDPYFEKFPGNSKWVVWRRTHPESVKLDVPAKP